MMNKEFIYKQLLNILKEDKIKVDEPMKKHISFKVGGPADFLVKPETEEELIQVIKLVKKENIPFLVIGNGSNLLVKDGGIRGVVIELTDNFNNYEIEGNIIKAQSGALLSILGRNALKNSLTGFEFAAGIPGTLGGALAMNAGAYAPPKVPGIPDANSNPVKEFLRAFLPNIDNKAPLCAFIIFPSIS